MRASRPLDVVAVARQARVTRRAVMGVGASHGSGARSIPSLPEGIRMVRRRFPTTAARVDLLNEPAASARGCARGAPHASCSTSLSVTGEVRTNSSPCVVTHAVGAPRRSAGALTPALAMSEEIDSDSCSVGRRPDEGRRLDRRRPHARASAARPLCGHAVTMPRRTATTTRIACVVCELAVEHDDVPNLSVLDVGRTEVSSLPPLSIARSTCIFEEDAPCSWRRRRCAAATVRPGAQLASVLQRAQ